MRALRPALSGRGWVEAPGGFARELSPDLRARLEIGVRRETGGAARQRAVQVTLGVWVGPIERELRAVFGEDPRADACESTVSASLDALAGRARPRRIGGRADLDDVARGIARNVVQHGEAWLAETTRPEAMTSALERATPGSASARRRLIVAAWLDGSLEARVEAMRPALARLPGFEREALRALLDHLRARAPAARIP